MRLLICAGGTGGGVYPALSIAQALGARAEAVLWVGGEKGMEMNLVQHAGFTFRGIPAAGLHGVGVGRLPGNLVQLLKGISASRRILNEFKPDTLLFTGGYVAVPMALAGRKLPSLLYVPDIEPGLALKTLSRYAKVIAVSVEESRRFFNPKKNVVVTGYPTRSGLSKWSKPQGLKRMNCTPDRQTLLVMGGSKGARSINRALFQILPNLLDRFQVIHISGELDHQEALEVQSSLDPKITTHYHLYAYLHDEIGAALTAADLVVSRAGASVLGDYPLFGLPSILVPYPYAWRYQKVNADFLVNHGAAILINNGDLSTRLLLEIDHLLTNPADLKKMSDAVKKLASPDASKRLADLVTGLVPKGATSHD